MVKIKNSPTHRLGCKAELRFQITQHCRDELLMESLVEYLGCEKYLVVFFAPLLFPLICGGGEKGGA
jgi:hypothetical protein